MQKEEVRPFSRDYCRRHSENLRTVCDDIFADFAAEESYSDDREDEEA